MASKRRSRSFVSFTMKPRKRPPEDAVPVGSVLRRSASVVTRAKREADAAEKRVKELRRQLREAEDAYYAANERYKNAWVEAYRRSAGFALSME